MLDFFIVAGIGGIVILIVWYRAWREKRKAKDEHQKYREMARRMME